MSTTTGPLELEDLLTLTGKQLHAIMDRSLPIDVDALVGKQFLGTDLSMPKIGQKLLWQTFRKTFVRDPEHGDIRGWNVRMEQRGFHGAQVPLRRKDGTPKSFAHYRVRSAEGIAWPRGWKGQHFLDYSIAGNNLVEGLGYTPIVAVNEGSSDLLLGWEIFKVGGKLLAPSMYWAIRADGPVEDVAQPARPPRL